MEKYRDDIIKSIMDLVKYKSISEKSEKPGEPFGIECRKALEYILELRK